MKVLMVTVGLLTMPGLFLGVCDRVTQASDYAEDESEHKTLLPQPPEEVELPEPGFFKVRWVEAGKSQDNILAMVPGIYTDSGHYPLVSYFQVDYRGPKQKIELVAESRVKGELVSSTVVYRQYYSITGPVSVSPTRGERLVDWEITDPRQMFCLRFYRLDGSMEKNALVSVIWFDAERQQYWNADQKVFYAAAFDDHYAAPKMSRGEAWMWLPIPSRRNWTCLVGTDEPIPDDREVVMLSHTEGDDVRTEIKLRFVDE